MSYPFDRRTYRLPYPQTARARLLLENVEVALVDCSERGLRYIPGTTPLPEVGSRVSGRVRLLSGGPPLAVEGTVIRIQAGEVAVELLPPGIPVNALFTEQRHLARRFPARFHSSSG